MKRGKIKMIIKINNLSKTFNDGKKKKTILENLNLSIKTGQSIAITGRSGCGKTTLLNNLDTTLNRSTGEISGKLGRGRHTTRQAELFKTCGGYVIDTPGFSSFEFEKNDYIKKDD